MQADAPASTGLDVATPASFVTPSPGAPGATSMPPPAAVKFQGAARGVAVSTAADTTDPGESSVCASGAARVVTRERGAGRLATPGVRQRRKPADDKLRKARPCTRAPSSRCAECVIAAVPQVTGRLFTDVPAQSLRRSSRLSGLPTGPMEVRMLVLVRRGLLFTSRHAAVDAYAWPAGKRRCVWYQLCTRAAPRRNHAARLVRSLACSR